MDGLQAARILKKAMPKVAIILFTNFGPDPFMEREALAVGIRKVVSKANSSALVNSVDAALSSLGAESSFARSG
jgi:DNA-binding NarL/FixJ family response regulator